MPSPWLAALPLSLIIFVITRHLQLVSRRCPRRRPGTAPARSDDYCLFVLGSGGHTKEMLMMMDDGTTDLSRVHRRYLISSGDLVSAHHAEAYEESLRQRCTLHHASPGTHDRLVVARARRVHQPLWSVPFSILRCVVSIIPALLNPTPRGSTRPSRIFSNGPATGFVVALVVHLLKVFFVVPATSMNFIYIESWARISSLSLTGKLLFHSGIADVFVVQHPELARKYGLHDAGEMVFNCQR